jgi:hypothetical protein
MSLQKAINLLDGLNDTSCNKMPFYLQIIDELIKTIDTIKKYSTDTGNGSILFSANVKLPVVVPKYEYMIYMDIYGPPIFGQFNQTVLEKIRKDYAKYYV